MPTPETARRVLCVIGCGTAAASVDGSIGPAAAAVTLPVPRAATEGRSTAGRPDSTPYAMTIVPWSAWKPRTSGVIEAVPPARARGGAASPSGGPSCAWRDHEPGTSRSPVPLRGMRTSGTSPRAWRSARGRTPSSGRTTAGRPRSPVRPGRPDPEAALVRLCPPGAARVPDARGPSGPFPPTGGGRAGCQGISRPAVRAGSGPSAAPTAPGAEPDRPSASGAVPSRQPSPGTDAGTAPGRGPAGHGRLAPDGRRTGRSAPGSRASFLHRADPGAG